MKARVLVGLGNRACENAKLFFDNLVVIKKWHLAAIAVWGCLAGWLAARLADWLSEFQR
jgi:hypothetical protein